MTVYTSVSLKAELNDKGWRLTPQRQTILHVFQQLPKGQHLTAENLYHQLESQESGKGISLSTIYRTLKLMGRMGILRELELGEGHKHYELNQPYSHHHDHLVCVRCNKIIEFTNDSILNIATQTAQTEGYHLLGCQLTIHAVCPTCQQVLMAV